MCQEELGFLHVLAITCSAGVKCNSRQSGVLYSYIHGIKNADGAVAKRRKKEKCAKFDAALTAWIHQVKLSMPSMLSILDVTRQMGEQNSLKMHLSMQLVQDKALVLYLGPKVPAGTFGPL